MIFYIKIFCSLNIPIKQKIFILIIFFLIIYLILDNNNALIKTLNINYMTIQNDINIHFNNNINSKINIGVHCYSLKNGGRARLTTLLLNYLYKVKIFKLYLFTEKYKEENEYKIPEDIKRIIINEKTNLIKEIKKHRINIVIYQLSNVDEIKELNKLKSINVIYYLHSCFFYWLYLNDFSSLISVYKELQKSKHVITLVPFENNYLFKKWGINSILSFYYESYEIFYIPNE